MLVHRQFFFTQVVVSLLEWVALPIPLRACLRRRNCHWCSNLKGFHFQFYTPCWDALALLAGRYWPGRFAILRTELRGVLYVN